MKRMLSVMIAVVLAALPGWTAVRAVAAVEAATDSYALKLWTVEERLPDSPLVGLTQTADGYLWLVSRRMLMRFNGTEFVEIPVPTFVRQHVGEFTGVSVREGVMVSGQSGVAHYVKGDWSMVQHASLSEVRDDAAADIHTGRSGRVWIHDEKGVAYSTGNGDWHRIGFPENAAGAAVLMEVSDGALWLGNPTGVFRWHEGIWQRITEQDTLGSLSVNRLLEGNDGTVWAACDGGLLRIRRKAVQTLNAEGTVVSGTAYSLWRMADGGAWIGYKGRAIRVNANGRLLMTHYLEPDVPISALLQDSKGRVWLGTLGSGLYSYQGKAFLTPVLRMDQAAPSVHTVYALLETPSGEIWVASQQGLMRVNAAGCLEPLLVGGEYILDGVRGLYLDAQQSIWVLCERDGLVRVTASGTITRFGRQRGLQGNPRVVYQDQRGHIWVGSTSGLHLLLEDQLVFVGRQVGIADDAVMLIVDDAKGRLWLGTTRGLQCVYVQEPRSLEQDRSGTTAMVRMIHLGIADGLVSERCMGNMTMATRVPQTPFWLPFENGVTMVDPASIAFSSSPPSVVMEMVSANNRTVFENEELARSPLIFEPGSRNMTFRFAALSPGNPSSIRYRYRIDNQPWSVVQADPVATFEWLPPGRHTIQVIAEANGIWNLEGCLVAFEVKAFFWQTISFYLALTVLLAVAIFSVVRWLWWHRYQLQLALLKREEALAQERARISRDIHDDLGNGLSVVATLSELAHHDVEKESAHKRLDQIYDVANELARNVDEIVWAVNPANDGWEPFLSYFEQYTEYFLGNSGLRFHFVRPTLLVTRPIPSKTRHHLLLAVREAVGNVLKHAQAKQVKISMTLEGEALEIRVEDDGRGFDTTKPSEIGHDGLNNMVRRMREINGSIDIVSQVGHGTQIVFRVALDPISAT